MSLASNIVSVLSLRIVETNTRQKSQVETLFNVAIKISLYVCPAAWDLTKESKWERALITVPKPYLKAK